MNDRVELIIGDRVIDRFMSYTIDSQIYNAASSFSLQISPDYKDVVPGSKCKIKVNNELVMTGMIERVNKGGKKGERYLKVGGRDLMGQIISAYLVSFGTIKQSKLISLAERALRFIPNAKTLSVLFSAEASKVDVPQEYVQPEPGQTWFSLLSSIAVSRGILFYSWPDGTLVFGKPKGRGRVKFQINNIDGMCDVLDYDLVDDITEQFSEIQVCGQKQDTGKVDIETLNQHYILQNAGFPFYKPFVCATSSDAQSPKEQARLILEQQKFNGHQLSYTVAGHSQNGSVWQTDELVAVYDEEVNVKGIRLIYGRQFSLSKEGTRTALTLGHPGVIQ